mgnify:CR=1 FL=1
MRTGLKEGIVYALTGFIQTMLAEQFYVLGTAAAAAGVETETRRLFQ